MINIQDISDNTLLRVIHEGDSVKWKLFALKVMISRLKLKLSIANDEEMIRQCCEEMRKLLFISRNIPNANKDVQTIVDMFGY